MSLKWYMKKVLFINIIKWKLIGQNYPNIGRHKMVLLIIFLLDSHSFAWYCFHFSILRLLNIHDPLSIFLVLHTVISPWAFLSSTHTPPPPCGLRPRNTPPCAWCNDEFGVFLLNFFKRFLLSTPWAPVQVLIYGWLYWLVLVDI